MEDGFYRLKGVQLCIRENFFHCFEHIQFSNVLKKEVDELIKKFMDALKSKSVCRAQGILSFGTKIQHFYLEAQLKTDTSSILTYYKLYLHISVKSFRFEEKESQQVVIFV